MKKIIILLFSLLISFNSYGEELKSLFGITLNANAENYVSSSYIESNKREHLETFEGYFNLIITEKIKRKSPYISYYKITIDEDNMVRGIYGSNILENLEICQEIQKDLVSILEKKYQINFKYWEKTYPSFKKYAYYSTFSTQDLMIQCRESYTDSSIRLQLILDDITLSDAIYEFYDAGM